MATSNPQFVNQMKCIFCTNEANSDEHPLPQWLDNVMGPRLDGAFHYQTRTKGAEVVPTVKKKSGGPRSKRLRVVCTNCNNVWMSQLQDAAITLVSSLIRDEDVTIDARDATVLAAWTAMTTMVLEFDDIEHATIPGWERSWLRSLRIPPPMGWRIYAGRLNEKLQDEWYCHRPAALTYVDDVSQLPPTSAVKLNVQRSFLSLGKLAIVAFSTTSQAAHTIYPFSDGANRFADEHGFMQVWPPTNSKTKWRSLPTRKQLDLDMIAFANSPQILLEKYSGMCRILSKPPRNATPTGAQGPD